MSAVDKLHNARSILADQRVTGDDLWGRFNGATTGSSLRYCTRLPGIPTERLVDTSGVALSAKLEHTVGEITAHAKQLGNPVQDELAVGQTREAETRAATPSD